MYFFFHSILLPEPVSIFNSFSSTRHRLEFTLLTHSIDLLLVCLELLAQPNDLFLFAFANLELVEVEQFALLSFTRGAHLHLALIGLGEANGFLVANFGPAVIGLVGFFILSRLEIGHP